MQSQSGGNGSILSHRHVFCIIKSSNNHWIVTVAKTALSIIRTNKQIENNSSLLVQIILFANSERKDYRILNILLSFDKITFFNMIGYDIIYICYNISYQYDMIYSTDRLSVFYFKTRLIFWRSERCY